MLARLALFFFCPRASLACFRTARLPVVASPLCLPFLLLLSLLRFLAFVPVSFVCLLVPPPSLLL